MQDWEWLHPILFNKHSSIFTLLIFLSSNDPTCLNEHTRVIQKLDIKWVAEEGKSLLRR